MSKITKNIIMFSLCAGLLLSGCDKSGSPEEIVVSGVTNSQNGFPASSCGVNLQKSVEKAVSLSPAITEIICEMGFKDRLVGISDYCDFPTELSCDKVGSSENPDLDKILNLSPDAVFTLSALSERDIYRLNQSGISVLTPLVPQNMEDYSTLYKEISTAFYGCELTDSQLGIQKSAQIGKDSRLTLENSAKSLQMESFLYITGKQTIAGTETFENAVLSLCGKNLCTQSGYISVSDYIGEPPKFLIVDSALTTEIIEDSEELSALVGELTEIRFVNSARLERPTARTAEIFTQIRENTLAATSDSESTSE